MGNSDEGMELDEDTTQPPEGRVGPGRTQRNAPPKPPEVDVMQGMNARDYMPDLLSLDMTTIDPSLHYRWVQNSKMRIARHRLLGYRTVLRKSGVKLSSDVDDDQGDDTIIVGDMILMACDKNKFDRRKRGEEMQATTRLSSVKGKFKKKARNKVRGVDYLDEGD